MPAAGPAGLHKFRVCEHHDLGPHGAGVDGDIADTQGDNQIQGVGAEGGHNGDGQQGGGDGVEHVQHPHDAVVQTLAVVARHGAQQSADDHGHGGGGQAND